MYIINKLEIDRECIECNEGLMKKPFPIHSFDFNEEGRVPLYCTFCGCGFREEMIQSTGHVLVISNNFIKKVLKILCNRERNFSYIIRDKIKTDINDKKFFNAYDLAEFLMMEFEYHKVKMDFDFIIYSIFCQNLGNYSIFSFT